MEVKYHFHNNLFVFFIQRHVWLCSWHFIPWIYFLLYKAHPSINAEPVLKIAQSAILIFSLFAFKKLVVFLIMILLPLMMKCDFLEKCLYWNVEKRNMNQNFIHMFICDQTWSYCKDWINEKSRLQYYEKQESIVFTVNTSRTIENPSADSDVLTKSSVLSSFRNVHSSVTISHLHS